MIFVFGSNLSGIHGAGAAAYAHQYLGAKWGVGEGPTGSTYALPTKNEKIQDMTLAEIKTHINKFLVHATSKKDQQFKVTCVGCGLAKWTHASIAPLFLAAPDNCFFDELWKPYLGDNYNYWGTF